MHPNPSMALEVETAFMIFGGILIIGYIGELISRKFNIPSILFLLIIGFLLRLFGYVDLEALTGIQELFGTLALIVLLFDGGLSIKLREVFSKSSRVLVMALLMITVSMLLTSIVFIFLGQNWVLGAIFGAIIGTIGSSTTIAMLKNINVPKSIKDFLILESSLTDVLAIVMALVLTQALISGSVDIRFLSQSIASRFSVGFLVALIYGLATLYLLSRVEKGYSYMTTFALYLILYALTEFLGGSGAIAVLTLGIIYGNERSIREFFKIDVGHDKHMVMAMQSEISFFIRTFFFVFLGAVVTVSSLVNFGIAVLLVLLLYGGRYFSAFLSTYSSSLREHIEFITAMNPRGLATAVLATYPLNALLSSNTLISQNLSLLKSLPELAFYVIILTLAGTTVLIPYVIDKKNKKEEEKEKSD